MKVILIILRLQKNLLITLDKLRTLLIFLLLLLSCDFNYESNDNIVARAGEKTLTNEELIEKLPKIINSEDSLIISNYVFTNLYLLYLLDNMKNKSSILSNNFNQNYINKFSNIIDSEILDNLDDYVFSKITSDSNFKMFIEKIKKNDFKLSIDEIRSFSDQSLLSIPKSKDTLLSLFFGEKFSKTISNWGKERK